MKRGGIRTHRIYTTEKDGSRTIQYGLQGKKNKLWIPIVETINKKQEFMIYKTLQEAEKQLKAIVKPYIIAVTLGITNRAEINNTPTSCIDVTTVIPAINTIK